MSWAERQYHYWVGVLTIIMGVGHPCIEKVARALSGWLGGCGC